MSVRIQVRNVPDDGHRVMKERAAKAGMSLSDYLLREVRQMASRPTMEEFRDGFVRGRPFRSRLLQRIGACGA